ncbi:hypothetical protein PCANC_07087 [Puccinia coronata f. sp. avenae]|uniref:Uncharacterized protein n=1 Tax=Puccinia coronata f. sp. avenae TaxID=200324 RepID=A0A2N5VIM8_9BASI|nr:hypothetical protein PCANC_07087 [Puccinia coronata f. sp. avenae]
MPRLVKYLMDYLCTYNPYARVYRLAHDVLDEAGNLTLALTGEVWTTLSFHYNDSRGLIAARPKGVCTPKKNGVQPLHAASERRAEAARPSLQAARHSHAFNRRAYGVQPCQTGVQSLHACLEGVQSLHALRTGVQALHACRLTSNCAAHVSLSNREAYVSQPRPVPLELTWARVQKPTTKFNHPDPQATDRPRPTDTHQTQPSR